MYASRRLAGAGSDFRKDALEGAQPVEIERGAKAIDRQHRRELELVRAVPAELGDPVVVGLAEAERQQRVEVVARDQAEPGRREQHRDVDALHRHAHHLRLGIDDPVWAPTTCTKWV